MVNSRDFTLAPLLPCTHAQKAPLHKFPDTCDLLFKINSKINLETKVTGWLPPPGCRGPGWRTINETKTPLTRGDDYAKMSNLSAQWLKNQAI